MLNGDQLGRVQPEGFFEGVVNDNDSLKMKRRRVVQPMRPATISTSLSFCVRPILCCMAQEKEVML